MKRTKGLAIKRIEDQNWRGSTYLNLGNNETTGQKGSDRSLRSFHIHNSLVCLPPTTCIGSLAMKLGVCACKATTKEEGEKDKENSNPTTYINEYSNLNGCQTLVSMSLSLITNQHISTHPGGGSGLRALCIENDNGKCRADLPHNFAS